MRRKNVVIKKLETTATVPRNVAESLLAAAACGSPTYDNTVDV
jgi:hypothetical protein